MGQGRRTGWRRSSSGDAMRVMVVGHGLVLPENRRRWQVLADAHGVSVTLVLPRRWRSSWLKRAQQFETEAYREGDLEVLPLPTTSDHDWNRYLYRSADLGMAGVRPDLIYVLHEETALVHAQVIAARRLYAPRAVLAFFTPLQLAMSSAGLGRRLLWRAICREYGAAFCHYPTSAEALRRNGFGGDVFTQTQVGINEAVFYGDAEARAAARSELGVEGRFVIGFVGRLTADKGIPDLLQALPLPDVDWSLLLVGDGDYGRQLREQLAQRGLAERVILAGTVPLQRVGHYMRAMDCLVAPSRTTPAWVDTFPLVTVQAMRCGVPVIGSDSGAIPFQLGDDGLVVPERDSGAIHHALLRLARDAPYREALGQRGQARADARFSTGALAAEFAELAARLLSKGVAA